MLLLLLKFLECKKMAACPVAYSDMVKEYIKSTQRIIPLITVNTLMY